MDAIRGQKDIEILTEIQKGTITEYKNVFITTTVHINFKGLQKQ